MKKISIALLISLMVMYMSYEGARGYVLLKKGARLSSAKEYDMADEVYNRLAGGTFSGEALRNKMINLYRAGRYEKVSEIQGQEYFLRGNSYVYLEDQSGGGLEENYKKALEEYRQSMERSSDINIKKNYEIVMKKLKDHEQNQQDNQEQNKDRSQQDKDQNGQDKKGRNTGDPQGDKDDKGMEGESGQDDNSGDKGDPEDKRADSPGSGDGGNTEDTTSGKEGDEKGDLHRREAMTILEGLERNESQAFKNNERLERTLGGEEEDESW